MKTATTTTTSTNKIVNEENSDCARALQVFEHFVASLQRKNVKRPSFAFFEELASAFTANQFVVLSSEIDRWRYIFTLSRALDCGF